MMDGYQILDSVFECPLEMDHDGTDRKTSVSAYNAREWNIYIQVSAVIM